MLKQNLWKRSLLVIPLLAAGLLSTGCATRVSAGYRGPGPVYVDRWGPPEYPYYNRWIVETRHRRVEYVHLSRRDQRAYWAWRHNHR